MPSAVKAPAVAVPPHCSAGTSDKRSMSLISGFFQATLHELVGNRIQLNRLLGLSNLYYIDPEDQEILQELRQVRLSLGRSYRAVP